MHVFRSHLYLKGEREFGADPVSIQKILSPQLFVRACACCARVCVYVCACAFPCLCACVRALCVRGAAFACRLCVRACACARAPVFTLVRMPGGSAVMCVGASV